MRWKWNANDLTQDLNSGRQAFYLTTLYTQNISKKYERVFVYFYFKPFSYRNIRFNQIGSENKLNSPTSKRLVISDEEVRFICEIIPKNELAFVKEKQHRSHHIKEYTDINSTDS